MSSLASISFAGADPYEPRTKKAPGYSFSKILKGLWEMFMSDGKINTGDLSKLLSQRGKKVNVKLKKGITLHEVTVEYMTDNLVLFVLKNGEYKATHPSEIEHVAEE